MSTNGSRGMSNGARHGLGAVAGLALTPVIAGLLMFGIDRLYRSLQVFRADAPGRWIGVAAIVFAAVLLGLLMGSRLSPVASLIPGVIFIAAGLPWLLAAEWTYRTLRDLVPGRHYIMYANLGSLGLWVLLGCALLAASAPASRWRGAAAGPPPQPRFAAQPAGPWAPAHQVPGQGPGQGPGHVPPQRPAGPPPFDPNAQPYGPPAPTPAPGEAVPGQLGQPGPATPQPPSPARPPAPGDPAGPSGAQERAADDDDEPGEWTRMYGGRNS